MARRILLVVAALATALLAGCASTPKVDDVVYAPNFNGIYRLAYSNTGNALYYRFFNDGLVLSARSDAPAANVYSELTLENANTSRGTWTAAAGELRVGVDEGTVSYDSRFDIRADGRIALRGLPRSFEFIPSERVAKAMVSSR